MSDWRATSFPVSLVVFGHELIKVHLEKKKNLSMYYVYVQQEIMFWDLWNWLGELMYTITCS